MLELNLLQQKLEGEKLDRYFLPQVTDLFLKYLQNTKDLRSRL